MVFPFPVFAFLHWSFAALAAGSFPEGRHDGLEWDKLDSQRALAAGNLMALVGALILIKGDWAEYARTFGFPTWSSVDHTCLFCFATRGSMLRKDLLEASSPRGLPWREKNLESYQEACARCEIRVAIPDASRHRNIRNVLFYDKRKDGSSGRALRDAIPDLGLEPGDRLEPSSSMPNVADFYNIYEFPCEAVFWRPSLETA